MVHISYHKQSSGNLIGTLNLMGRGGTNVLRMKALACPKGVGDAHMLHICLKIAKMHIIGFLGS